MIMYSTRARIAGSIPEAVAWARDVAALVTKKSGVAVEVAARVGGGQDIIWVSRAKDMAELEKVLDKIQGDADYQSEVEKARKKGLFDSHSIETAIWRTL
jgi:hypothetical protein